MKDASMSLGIYFEIKDAELYGGEGTTGYAATIVEISIEGLQNADFEKYANSQLEAMASMAKVPKEFAKDYANNRFDDFFRRVYADIDNEGMCGNYEGETAQMMARAFKESRCLDYEKTR